MVGDECECPSPYDAVVEDPVGDATFGVIFPKKNREVSQDAANKAKAPLTGEVGENSPSTERQSSA